MEHFYTIFHNFFQFQEYEATEGETGWVEWLFKHWGFISGQKSLTETTVVEGLFSRMKNLHLQPKIWSPPIDMLLPKCLCLMFGCMSQELNLQQQQHKNLKPP
jgi:hypothetical protein